MEPFLFGQYWRRNRDRPRSDIPLECRHDVPRCGYAFCTCCTAVSGFALQPPVAYNAAAAAAGGGPRSAARWWHLYFLRRSPRCRTPGSSACRLSSPRARLTSACRARVLSGWRIRRHGLAFACRGSLPGSRQDHRGESTATAFPSTVGHAGSGGAWRFSRSSQFGSGLGGARAESWTASGAPSLNQSHESRAGGPVRHPFGEPAWAT